MEMVPFYHVIMEMVPFYHVIMQFCWSCACLLTLILVSGVLGGQYDAGRWAT